jgi:type II secretory pathway component PulJ
MEMIVVLAVFSLISSITAAFFATTKRVSDIETTHANLQLTARQGVANAMGDIRSASSIETSATLAGTFYETSSDTIVLRIPSLDANIAPIAGIYDYVVYQYNEYTGILTEISFPDNQSIRASFSKDILSDLTSFAFSYYTSAGAQTSDITQAVLVKIDLTLQKTTKGKTSEVNFVDQATIRNR